MIRKQSFGERRERGKGESGLEWGRFGYDVLDG